MIFDRYPLMESYTAGSFYSKGISGINARWEVIVRAVQTRWLTEKAKKASWYKAGAGVIDLSFPKSQQGQRVSFPWGGGYVKWQKLHKMKVFAKVKIRPAHYITYTSNK